MRTEAEWLARDIERQKRNWVMLHAYALEREGMALESDERAIGAFEELDVRVERTPVFGPRRSGCESCRWHALDAEGNELDGSYNASTLLSWHVEGYFTAASIQRVA